MRILTITYLLFLTTISLATGPSSLTAIIQPIATNDSGSVLCKTKYSYNEMGAHKAMTIFYGYCIISKDTIIEFEHDTLIADENINWEIIEKHKKIKESEFEKKIEQNDLNRIEQKLFNIYNFSLIELTRQVKVVNLDLLKHKLESTTQKTIKSGESSRYESNKLMITFETDDIIFVQNKIQIEDSEDYPIYGASFDFENYITIRDGTNQNVGFDIFDVTGVLFKKN